MTGRNDRRGEQLGENFSLLVERRADGPRLHVGGDLDLANFSRFRRLLTGLVAERPPAVEVDLSRLDLVETMTAAALLRLQADAQDEGVPVRLNGARGSVAALLRLASSRLSRPSAER